MTLCNGVFPQRLVPQAAPVAGGTSASRGIILWLGQVQERKVGAGSGGSRVALVAEARLKEVKRCQRLKI